MPLPFLLWGAAAVGAAIAGKAIYDAVTDEGSSSSTTTTTSSSGPSREEVQRQQLESIYTDFQKEFREFWQREDQLLCLKDDDALTECQELPEQVRTAELTPARALEMLYGYERKKSCLNTLTPIKDVEFLFNMSPFDDSEDMIESINTSITVDETNNTFEELNNLFQDLENAWEDEDEDEDNDNDFDDDFTSFPRIAFADNYELCRDEGLLASLLSGCEPERVKALGALPGDWRRLTPELARCWKEVQNLEAATAEGSEPRVVVCGMLKAGKSSLLNSLFDDPTNQHFPTARSRKTCKNQSEVRNGIRFVDTPGQDHDEEDTEEARNAYAGADLLLFVHGGTSELEETHLSFLQKLQAMHPDLGEKTLFVITYKAGAGEHLEWLKDKISEKVQERCGFVPEIFAVDNTSYRHEKEKVRASSGIPELRAAIESRCGEISGRLLDQRRERRAKAMEGLRAILEAVARPVRQEREQLGEQHAKICKSFTEIVENKKRLANGVRS